MAIRKQQLMSMGIFSAQMLMSVYANVRIF